MAENESVINILFRILIFFGNFSNNGKVISNISLIHVKTTALQNNLSGPLFNLKGELLGLISSKFLIGGNGRMAVAVSINTVLETI